MHLQLFTRMIGVDKRRLSLLPFPAALGYWESMKLSDLQANPRNPRKITQEKLKMLTKSMDEFGSLDGILYNRRTQRLFGGHQRQKVDPSAEVTVTQQFDPPTKVGTVAIGYVISGEERYPYREVDWDEDKETAANIAANKGAGAWDLPELSSQMLDLDSKNYDMDLTMWDEQERENLIVPIEVLPGQSPEDEAPEPPKDPITRRGDVYVLGHHRLICGDATNLEDYTKLMQGEQAHIVWTDPPYNVSYKGKTKKALTIENDTQDDEAFYKFLYDFYTNVSMNLQEGGAIYIAHADSEGANFRKAMTDSGLLLKQCLIWVKQSLVMSRQDYHWKHEPILYGWKPGSAHSWYADRKQTTVLNFDRPSRNAEHPTMKPVELVEYCLKNSAINGHTVLDCFGGSGTTMIAAEKLGMKARIMEMDPRYCDVIVSRWQKYTGRMAERVTSESDQEPEESQDEGI